MQAHTFLISFFTAHFKRHETKKFRSCYFLPPPTVIWGIIGTIFGIERERLNDFVRINNFNVGSELCDFKGLATEKATLMSWDTGEQGYTTTVENFEFLIEPTYRLGIYAKNELIQELKDRIEMKNFKFDLYGGISDCFLKEIRNEDGVEFMEGVKVKGMIPTNFYDGFSHITVDSRIMRVLYLNTFFYQGLNVEFKVKKRVKTVNGIAVWDANDIELFRKGI